MKKKCECGKDCTDNSKKERVISADAFFYKKFGKCFVCANVEALRHERMKMALGTGLIKYNSEYSTTSSQPKYILSDIGSMK